MFDLFKSSVKFCEVTLKPWIIFLSILCVFVVLWGIFKYDVAPDSFKESLAKNIGGEPALLTNMQFSNPQFEASMLGRGQADYSTQLSPLPQIGAGITAGQATENSFKQAIIEVLPAVVNIKSTRLGATGNTQETVESIGSGLIISPEGHVLTNYHVIANSHNILVSVYGMRQKTYEAWVYDHHSNTDLTILKIETNDIFSPPVLGNSDLVETGDMIIAIGNPFGMDQTVTSGIVSGVRKSIVIDGVKYENMIQTDASINRGSSGGPLVNMNGEVIGINTAIYAPTGVFSGTSFAMPINKVKRFLSVHNMKSTGNIRPVGFSNNIKSNTSNLGIETQPVDQTIALHNGLPYIGGVLVNRVNKNSSLSKNGLKRGDVILEINDKEIFDVDNFENLLMSNNVDEPVKLLICRDKKLYELLLST